MSTFTLSPDGDGGHSLTDANSYVEQAAPQSSDTVTGGTGFGQFMTGALSVASWTSETGTTFSGAALEVTGTYDGIFGISNGTLTAASITNAKGSGIGAGGLVNAQSLTTGAGWLSVIGGELTVVNTLSGGAVNGGLQVSSGGRVSAAAVILGLNSFVSGATSTLTTSDLDIVGAATTFSITNGGTVTVNGNLEHAAGTIFIGHNGAKLEYSGNAILSGGAINVGASGLVATQAMTRTVEIGTTATQASMTATGLGTTLDFQDVVTVGSTGRGLVQIAEDAHVTAHEEVVVGDQAGGDGTISVLRGTFTAEANVVIGNGGKGALSVSGANSKADITQGNLDIGAGAGGQGTVSVSGATRQLLARNIFVADPGDPAPNLSGSLSVSNGASATVSNDLTIGGQAANNSPDRTASNFGTGTVFVSGLDTKLKVEGRTFVGGAVATLNNDDGATNGTDGDWDYSGGTGTLSVTSGGSFVAVGDLKLLGRINTAADGTQTAVGGIFIDAAGRFEIGGDHGTTAGTLEIHQNGRLFGHGMIRSDSSGQLPLGNTSVPGYDLKVVNKGTIEADSGLLAIRGNVFSDSATSQTKIGANSTLTSRAPEPGRWIWTIPTCFPAS